MTQSREHRPITDAAVVRRLTDAGAILPAKTTPGALAYGDVWFGGRTRNPWSRGEGSSGSIDMPFEFAGTRGVRALRAGHDPRWLEDESAEPLDRAALAAVRGPGVDLVEIELPDLPDGSARWGGRLDEGARCAFGQALEAVFGVRDRRLDGTGADGGAATGS